jgi:methionine synthase II (cobalamin-independent)
MANTPPAIHFSTTGIGSVPWVDENQACDLIRTARPDIPFWPQLVKRHACEDMSIQFSEGLPLLNMDEKTRSLTVANGDTENALVAFYDHFLQEDLDYFAVGADYARGFYKVVDELRRNQADPDGSCVKGQIVGPLTFGASIKDLDGKPILHNPDLMEAMCKGLSIKALWQGRVLQETGRFPILFVDEPYLSGFGSAFTPLERDEVIRILREMVDYLKQHMDIWVGIHCCGNTDWSMILESGFNIVSFDAFGYMDAFLLYEKEITGFLKNGGILAWGIVPTLDFTGSETTEDLAARLQEGIERLRSWGFEPGEIASQSMLTPACGMGTLPEADAEKVLALLSDLADHIKSRYP